MADQHAKHFGAIKGVKVVAGVDVDEKRASAFCAAHGIERSFTSLERALEWGRFEAVANVTPDSVHYTTTLTALHARKHVFCEKPLSTDYGRALEMTEAAEEAGLVAMVNLTYRNVAELQRARAIVQSGAIGAVRHIEASYLQSWLVSKAWGDWRKESKWLWRLSKKHGSNGVLGDIGIHILDFAVYGAATEIDTLFCRLKTFHKAEGDRIGDYPLDANDSFAMTVDFSNGALGVVHASRFATGHMNDLTLRIFGDRGALEVHHSPKQSKLLTCLGADIESGVWSEEAAPAVPTNYQRFVEAVRSGNTLDPSFRHAAGLQRVLDLAAAADAERKERAIATG
jgi:predicted dehydrogenase